MYIEITSLIWKMYIKVFSWIYTKDLQRVLPQKIQTTIKNVTLHRYQSQHRFQLSPNRHHSRPKLPVVIAY